MIELKIEPYCHNCMMFEADVHKDKIYADNQESLIRTMILCRNRKICNNLKNYLQKEADKQ